MSLDNIMYAVMKNDKILYMKQIEFYVRKIDLLFYQQIKIFNEFL